MFSTSKMMMMEMEMESHGGVGTMKGPECSWRATVRTRWLNRERHSPRVSYGSKCVQALRALKTLGLPVGPQGRMPQDQLHTLENFGWCRDRPQRALPLTYPNVNNRKKTKNEKETQVKKMWKFWKNEKVTIKRKIKQKKIKK